MCCCSGTLLLRFTKSALRGLFTLYLTRERRYNKAGRRVPFSVGTELGTLRWVGALCWKCLVALSLLLPSVHLILFHDGLLATPRCNQ